MEMLCGLIFWDYETDLLVSICFFAYIIREVQIGFLKQNLSGNENLVFTFSSIKTIIDKMKQMLYWIMFGEGVNSGKSENTAKVV